MNLLFFELIQVAIGRSDALSRVPSAKEWCELYGLSVKQALTGVCFCGVQRLANEQRKKMPRGLMMQWFAQAEQIRQRNELMNHRCVEVQRLLAKEGLKSSILKGQGVARLYRIRNEELGVRNDSQLGMYRQSGDIDVWVDGGMERVLRWCRERYGDVEYDYINAHVPMFKDVEVELHWRVGSMTNLFSNKRLQRWLERKETKVMILRGKADLKPETTIYIPTLEFNAFYLMLHCYQHVLESGLGLRQLMDYYFLLLSFYGTHGSEITIAKAIDSFSPEHTEEYGVSDLTNKVTTTGTTEDNNDNLDVNPKANVNRLFKEFGIKRFARGVMWIMQEVYGLERECLLCEPDEKEGLYILGEVMAGGNFGHHDERIKKVGKGKWRSVFAKMQHATLVLRIYPQEALWMPVWMVYHFVWKRTFSLSQMSRAKFSWAMPGREKVHDNEH